MTIALRPGSSLLPIPTWNWWISVTDNSNDEAVIAEMRLALPAVKYYLRESITPALRFPVNDYYRHDWYISGGCIGSILRNEEPNDFDIYFTSAKYVEGFLEHFRKHYVVTENDAYDGVSMYVQYRDKMLDRNVKLNLIAIEKYIGHPDLVTATFTFLHSRMYYLPLEDMLMASPAAYLAARDKILVPNHPPARELYEEKLKKQGFRYASSNSKNS